MKFKKFAAVILMSVMIGSMSLSGCGINKNATAVTMTGDAIDTIEVDMGYANFAARIQQASYDSIFASYYGEDYCVSMFSITLSLMDSFIFFPSCA